MCVCVFLLFTMIYTLTLFLYCDIFFFYLLNVLLQFLLVLNVIYFLFICFIRIILPNLLTHFFFISVTSIMVVLNNLYGIQINQVLRVVCSQTSNRQVIPGSIFFCIKHTDKTNNVFLLLLRGNQDASNAGLLITVCL